MVVTAKNTSSITEKSKLCRYRFQSGQASNKYTITINISALM